MIDNYASFIKIKTINASSIKKLDKTIKKLISKMSKSTYVIDIKYHLFDKNNVAATIYFRKGI